MTLGTELRKAREERGVTLRDLSERTQIRLPVLRAIEGDDFRHLPGGVIMRGFLKLYAREVGLDPDEIAKRYTAQLESAAPDRPGDGSNVASHGSTTTNTARAAASRFAGAGAIGVVVVLALLTVGYLAWRSPTGRDSDAGAGNPPPPEVAAPAEASSASRPEGLQGGTATPPPNVPTTGTSDTPPAAKAASADVLRVDLQASGPVWVSATADGQQVMYRQMDTGERLAIRATNEAVVRIGMPANVTMTINEQPVRPFARPGTPVTLRITPANYRDLLGQ